MAVPKLPPMDRVNDAVPVAIPSSLASQRRCGRHDQHLHDQAEADTEQRHENRPAAQADVVWSSCDSR